MVVTVGVSNFGFSNAFGIREGKTRLPKFKFGKFSHLRDKYR